MAHKPVYQVKQKVLASVAWRCCPGFAGSDCQHHGRAPCGLLPPQLLTPEAMHSSDLLGSTSDASSLQIPL